VVEVRSPVKVKQQPLRSISLTLKRKYYYSIFLLLRSDDVVKKRLFFLYRLNIGESQL
jgi:hypothetical protein